MAGAVRKVRVIPVTVVYNGVDLGYSKGGAVIDRKIIIVPIVVQGVINDEVIIRKDITVDIVLAETSYNRLESLLHFDLDRGESLLDYTATLTLTAVDNPADVTTVADAYCSGNTKVPFMFNNERVWPVQFKATYVTGDFYFAEIS